MRRRGRGERGWVASPGKTQFARTLRRLATPAEALLWRRLRGSALGVRFTRQRVVGGYIVDFFCASAALAVELDGATHDHRKDVDSARDADLKRLGVRVIRFSNSDVENDIESILTHLRLLLPAPPAPPLSRTRERGRG